MRRCRGASTLPQASRRADWLGLPPTHAERAGLGSGVNAAARSRNAAAAAIPPRDCARLAERSNSAARSSSAPSALARGARRGGRDRPADRSRRQAPGARRAGRPAVAAAIDRRAHRAGDGSGPGAASSIKPPPPPARPLPRPVRAAPLPAAAAPGRLRARLRRGAPSAGCCRGSTQSPQETLLEASGERLHSCDTPKPPASSPADSPCGSSSNANGLPRVSATIRSITRSSTRPRIAKPSRRRASSSLSPRTTIARATRQRFDLERVRASRTRARPTSPSSRRATNASVCADASIKPLSIVDDADQRRWPRRSRPATRGRRDPPRKRSGAGPRAKTEGDGQRPRAADRASARAGRATRRTAAGARQRRALCRPARLRRAPAMHPDACSARYSSSAVLPIPASPRTTEDSAPPRPSAVTSRPSRSCSRLRPRRRPRAGAVRAPPKLCHAERAGRAATCLNHGYRTSRYRRARPQGIISREWQEQETHASGSSRPPQSSSRPAGLTLPRLPRSPSAPARARCRCIATSPARMSSSPRHWRNMTSISVRG